MSSKRVLYTSGFLVLIVAVISACGALGLLTDPRTGWPGAAEGALIGLGVAAAVVIVHGVRIIFARTPEATSDAHHPDSLERYRLKEAASATLADALIVLGLAALGSFSILNGVDMRLVLVALFLTVLGDFAIRLLALRRKGY